MSRVARLVLAFIFVLLVADGRVLYADDSVRLMVGRSTVVAVGSPITRVSLTSADIADALVTSPTELLVNGKTPGTISMFVWDRAGAIKRYEVVVQRDLARLSEQLSQLFPSEKIEARSNGRDIVLAGTVSTKDIVEKAINLTAGYVDKKDEVVSLLQVAQGARTNQVLLKVRFAEVSRSALTQLGAGFFTSPNGYKDVVGRVTTQQFPAPGFIDRIGPPPPTNPNSEGKFTFSDFLNLFLFSSKYQVGTVIQALQTKGLFQSLAEPNLVAESGKEASFLAGGEFPVPIAQPSGGSVAITIMFKEFGVRLNFTPTVSGDRIHLKVRPEVSTLDFANGVTLQGFRIPALSTRRTETELELNDGQTFAIAGLLNNTMTKSLQKVPGIGDIPVLGLLFRSEAAQKDRTELVVMITPEILPNNSPGVTPNLPRVSEPFLPPLEQKKSMDPPPPAFLPQRGAAANTQSPATDAPAPPPAGDPAAAATRVQALTPTGRPVVHGDTLPAKPTATPSTTTTRPLSEQEKKVLARAHEQEAAAKAAEAKAREQQLQDERRKAEEQKKLDEKAAKRQAEIDKAASEAAARQAAEQARKQAEIDKKNRKVVAEAEAKLKAAQAAYESEVAKTKKP